MKRMSIYVLVGLVVVILLAILSVKFFLLEPPVTQPTDKKTNIRIGLLLGTLREERWAKDRDLFIAAAQKQGAFVQVMSANSDAQLQTTQAENLISQGVNVLVVIPQDGEKAAEIVDLAHKANIKVIAYDRMIKNSDLDYYISFDNEKVGSLQAQGVTSVKNEGNFAYVGGSPTDNNATLLKKGSMQVLQPLIDQGSVKLVVDAFTPDWNPDEAYKTVKQYLASGGTLDGIVAANDGTALGSIHALKEYNLNGKVPVSGQDAELSACQRIVQGTQTMTVYKPIAVLANKAAEIASAMAKGEQPLSNNKVNNGKIDVPSFLLEPISITKENMDATIIKDNYHTREQVYQNTN